MTRGEYHIRIEPHGRTVTATGAVSVLEAALAAGLNLPHSCRSGHCASCRARLVSGDIHYPNGRTAGLTAEEAQAGYILMCQARPRSNLTVQARLIANAGDVEMKTLPCRVARMERLAPDVMQMFLRLPAVETMPFRAGQYLDVLLEGGRRRSFSIASPPHDSGELELHVRRVPAGGFTSAVFEQLREGSLLRVEGPIGQFIYRESVAPAVLIAGGTGFAPLKAMLRHVLERPVAGEPMRPIHFYWGARRPVDLYEEALVLEWCRRFPTLKFTAVLSEAAALDEPAGHRRLGWVHEAVLADYPSLAGHDVYAAGPPALVEAIRSTFPAHGLDAEHLHFDSFDYAADSRTT